MTGREFRFCLGRSARLQQESLNCCVAFTFFPAGFLGIALQYVSMAGKGLFRVAIFFLKLNVFDTFLLDAPLLAEKYSECVFD